MASRDGARFEWNPAQDATNRRGHGIGFAEAARRFAPGSRWFDLDDDEHSGDELLYRAIGAIRRGVVVVVYTEVGGDEVRIIGARRATVRERRLYEDWIERCSWTTTSPNSPRRTSGARSSAR